MPSVPAYCDPAAYELLSSRMPVIETSTALLDAANAIALHGMDHVDRRDVDTELQHLTEEIRTRVRSDNQQALLAHAHEILFDEYGLGGNREDYYDPYNSYVPAVLDSRVGIPITLTLIYKNVLERLGLCVYGLNAPGHFLAEVELEDDVMIVDPFAGGMIHNRDEAFDLIESMAGMPIERSPQLLQRATHRQWIARILRNLAHLFDESGDRDNCAAMLEMQTLVLTE